MWIKKYTRPSNIQYDELIRGAGLMYNPIFNGTIKNILGFPIGRGFLEYYLKDNEWDDFMNLMARRIFAHRNYYRLFIKKYQDYGREYYLSAKAMDKDLKTYTGGQLFRLYRRFCRTTYKMGLFFFAPWVINEKFEPKFRSSIEQKFGPVSRKIFLGVEALTKEIRFDRQLKELLELKRRRRLTAAELKQHVVKYGYLNYYAIHHRPFMAADFLKMVKGLKPAAKLKAMRSGLKANQLAYQQALKLLKKDRQLLELAKLINLNVYLRNERMDLYREVIKYAKNFYAELDRRLGLTDWQSSFMTIKEIENYLTAGQKPNLAQIRERAKVNYCWYCIKGKRKIILNLKEIKRIYNREIGSSEKIKEFFGIVAYAGGKIKGKVKIIVSVEDGHKFKQGDILVASMTRPEYLSIMKKARAVVTDEGGITCHAAITAREFKIPCIIGTKIATKVLKDGDLVEVDANKGIVRKI